MWAYLRNIIRLSALAPTVFRRVKRQQKFVENILETLPDTYKHIPDNEDIRKIKLYGISIPALLGEAFCSFCNMPYSEKERSAITYFAMLTGPFDDLFDRHEMTDTQISQLLEMHQTDNAQGKLLQYFFRKGMETAAQTEIAKQTAMRVFAAQSAARAQKSILTKREILKQLSYEKGGASMLFYRCVLPENMHNPDDELVHQLGATGQLANDIFDIYKDLQEGIFTFANQCISIQQLRNEYQQQLQHIATLIQQSKNNLESAKTFALQCAPVLTRALVALDHYEKACIHTNGSFEPAKLTRKQLICDMEKPANIFKMIHYAAKWLSTL